MSDGSGVAEGIVSLPTGGGALAGLGEKFSPDLFTGTGNFTVPIELLEGRNGFQPKPRLTYSTGNGNGPFGLGWTLSVPEISRKTSDGVPIYDDAEDTFMLSKAEDLVPISGTDGKRSSSNSRTTYRPRTEGQFARIHHYTGPSTDYWEVLSKDGRTRTYGTPERKGHDPATTTDPSDPENVFAWHPTRTVDTYGNQIVYEYREDAGDTGSHQWNVPLLDRIRYVNVDADDESTYLVSVSFTYEDRPDPFSDYRAGFERRTAKRCKQIEVRTHADEDRLVRTYEFTYRNDRPGRSLPKNGVSLLDELTVTGHDGEQTQQLPPLEFDYTGFDPAEREFSPLDGQLPARSLAAPELELADLFGNGLPDIVEIDETIRYWRNTGNGEFAEPRTMRNGPAGLRLSDDGVQLIDANGDGRVDLLATTDETAGYFPLGFDGKWDGDSFQRYDVAPNVDFDDPDVRLVDLDGDGVTDAIRSSERFECFFNDPQEGWGETRRVPRRGGDTFPDVTFSDERVKWGDFSGDGLQDVGFIHDGSVEYWPNLGYGEWGNRIRMRNGPRLPSGHDPERLLVGDVDGDGVADLVYVEDNRVHLWINQSGNRWSDPITIDGTPPIADGDAVRLVDLHGTGIKGLLWSADDRGIGPNAYFLDFIGGTKPYLLDEMNNHMGAITHVSYAPSTDFYLADQRRPDTRWETSLPFPVQVVSRVEAIDAVSGGKRTTEYSYRHGYWDGAEREFRGFGLVKQRDSEDFEAYNALGLHGEDRPFAAVGTADRKQFTPPQLTKTWFHLGPVGDEYGDWREPDFSHEYWSDNPQLFSRPDRVVEGLGRLPRRARRDAIRTLRGRVLRREVYGLDGSDREDRPYTVTERLHGVREEHPLTDAERRRDRDRIFFPHSLGSRTTEWERGDDPRTELTFPEQYDDYGQPRSELKIAVPRDRDPEKTIPSGEDADPYLATWEVTEYARRDDESTYLVDRVARTTTYEVDNDGREDVFALADRIDRAFERGPRSAGPILGQTVNFYDGDAFTGEAFGTLGEHGALVRSETLVLTEDVIADAYGRGDVGSIPPYLTADADTEWTEYPDDVRSEYPKEFIEGLPKTESIDLTRPGLRITPTGHGVADDDAYVPGYFVPSKQVAYDFQTNPDRDGRGLVTAGRDELGAETTITYDEFDLLPIAVEDPAGLVTTASYNYRVFEPELVTDPNGNRTAHAYTPLGLLERVVVMGKEGEEKGDTFAQPGTRYRYDLRAFEERNEPIFVETIGREEHHWDLLRENPAAVPSELFPPNELDRFPERFIRTCEYSDGFGRVVQARTQAEDVVYGDPTFGGDELLVDQAVLVRDDDPDGPGLESIEELDGHDVGVENGTVGARLVDKLPNEHEGVDVQIHRYETAFAAVTTLEDGLVDAVVTDESVAIEFAKNGTVAVALTTGPGEIVGEQRSDEEPSRVVVSGWTTYDNKGNVVEQYEPFFDRGFAFRSHDDVKHEGGGAPVGQKVTTYYDPRGRAVRTVNPDGSEERTVHGVPAELNDPDAFQPSPWETYTYDENDNARRTHGDRLDPDTGDSHHPPEAYRHHWNTPSSEAEDARGRTVETTERTREEPGQSPVERRTRFTYDLRDNERTVTDALGREAFRHEYDLRNGRLRTESIDAGVRTVVRDAAGNALERRDGKGALALQAYDELSRPVRSWARDAGDEPLTLRERLVYGDRLEGAGADRNLLGELYAHYDEAGLLTFERYDFKANVLEKRRRVLDDEVVLAAGPVDWRPPDGTPLSEYAETVLEGDTDRSAETTGDGGYRTTFAYDALDRRTEIRYPADVEGDRKELRPRYNRAGDLQGVDLVVRPGTSDEVVEPYVKHVAYNAKGQRTFAAYGNGVMTRYAYDPETFRLVRLRTDEFATPDEHAYRPDGTVLQDYAYEYDLAGNVTTIRDRTPDSGIVDSPLGRHALDREFEYDPLYRLVAATGRECGSVANREPWDGRPRCADLTRTRPYEQRYEYDPVGNVRRLRHASGDRPRDASDDGSFTRRFSVGPEHDRLDVMTVGGTEYEYDHDGSGNLLREGGGRRFEWDHADRLRAFRHQAGSGESSLRASYRYDADGQRVSKLVEKRGGRLERTVYVDGIFEHRRTVGQDGPGETNTLHVMDDQRRIATVRVGGSADDDDRPSVAFHLSDHLGSSAVTVDETGEVIEREEYTPYGETSFGSAPGKRYRFGGKEYESESGLYYFGQRYYAPWQAKWTSPDPLGPVDGVNLYTYTRNNPVRYRDDDGTQSRESETIDFEHGSLIVAGEEPIEPGPLPPGEEYGPPPPEESDNLDPTGAGGEQPADSTGEADEPGTSAQSGGPPVPSGNVGFMTRMSRWARRKVGVRLVGAALGLSVEGDPAGVRHDTQTSELVSQEQEEGRRQREDDRRRGRWREQRTGGSSGSGGSGSGSGSGRPGGSGSPSGSSGGQSTAGRIASKGGRLGRKVLGKVPVVGNLISGASAGKAALEGDEATVKREAIGAIPILGTAVDISEPIYNWAKDIPVGPPTSTGPRRHPPHVHEPGISPPEM